MERMLNALKDLLCDQFISCRDHQLRRDAELHLSACRSAYSDAIGNYSMCERQLSALRATVADKDPASFPLTLMCLIVLVNVSTLIGSMIRRAIRGPAPIKKKPCILTDCKQLFWTAQHTAVTTILEQLTDAWKTVEGRCQELMHKKTSFPSDEFCALFLQCEENSLQCAEYFAVKEVEYITGHAQFSLEAVQKAYENGAQMVDEFARLVHQLEMKMNVEDHLCTLQPEELIQENLLDSSVVVEAEEVQARSASSTSEEESTEEEEARELQPVARAIVRAELIPIFDLSAEDENANDEDEEHSEQDDQGEVAGRFLVHQLHVIDAVDNAAAAERRWILEDITDSEDAFSEEVTDSEDTSDTEQTSDSEEASDSDDTSDSDDSDDSDDSEETSDSDDSSDDSDGDDAEVTADSDDCDDEVADSEESEDCEGSEESDDSTETEGSHLELVDTEESADSEEDEVEHATYPDVLNEFQVPQEIAADNTPFLFDHGYQEYKSQRPQYNGFMNYYFNQNATDDESEAPVNFPSYAYSTHFAAASQAQKEEEQRAESEAQVNYPSYAYSAHFAAASQTQKQEEQRVSAADSEPQVHYPSYGYSAHFAAASQAQKQEEQRAANAEESEHQVHFPSYAYSAHFAAASQAQKEEEQRAASAAEVHYPSYAYSAHFAAASQAQKQEEQRYINHFNQQQNTLVYPNYYTSYSSAAIQAQRERQQSIPTMRTSAHFYNQANYGAANVMNANHFGSVPVAVDPAVYTQNPFLSFPSMPWSNGDDFQNLQNLQNLQNHQNVPVSYSQSPNGLYDFERVSPEVQVRTMNPTPQSRAGSQAGSEWSVMGGQYSPFTMENLLKH